MGVNENSMSRYIVRVIITIDIMVSVLANSDSITSAKIVNLDLL